MQNLNNGLRKQEKKKQNSWDLTHVQKQNIGVDKRGDRKVREGGFSVEEGLGDFFKRKKWGEQFPRLAGVKEPQVLTKENKRTEYAEFLCGS